jgi:hypothetical protein
MPYRCSALLACCILTLVTGLSHAASTARVPAPRGPTAGAPGAGTPAAAAPATGAPAAGATPGTAWRAVDAARLDAARGGFQLASGLAVGLGIERTVAINGELVTQTRFAVADMRQLTPEQATLAREALSSVQLIQNGRVAGTPAQPGAAWGPALGATLIQNSLDNQRIDSRTVIDASVNTLGSLKSLNFSASVLDSLARTALPH